MSIEDDLIEKLNHDLRLAAVGGAVHLYAWHEVDTPGFPGFPAPTSEICLELGSTSQVRYGIYEEGAVGEQLARIADSIQGDLAYLASATWPLCPTHTHPAEARVVSGVAMWMCPDGGAVAPIGSFPPDESQH
jgi:hypothetical protein